MIKKSKRTFWERVKEVLQDAGLPDTQKYVAEKILQVKQPSISDWNKPGGFPTVQNAVLLAQHLNVCVEWLFTERGPKRPAPQDVAAQRLWDVWPFLDDVTKGELIGLASARVASGQSMQKSEAAG